MIRFLLALGIFLAVASVSAARETVRVYYYAVPQVQTYYSAGAALPMSANDAVMQAQADAAAGHNVRTRESVDRHGRRRVEVRNRTTGARYKYREY